MQKWILNGQWLHTFDPTLLENWNEFFETKFWPKIREYMSPDNHIRDDDSGHTFVNINTDNDSNVIGDSGEFDKDDIELVDKNSIELIDKDDIEFIDDNLDLTHYSVAKYLVDNHLWGKYVCGNITHSEMYEIKNCRWNKIVNFYYTIKNLILSEAEKIATVFAGGPLFTDNLCKIPNSPHIRRFQKNMKRLKSTYFSHGVVRECYDILYNENAKHIDNNYNLIGFDDCVYDTTTATFRQLEFADYISKTTGYSILPPIVNFDNINRDISLFFRRIEPRKTERQYLKLILANSVFNPSGYKYLLKGSGSNGISTMIKLVCLALGDLYTELSYPGYTQRKTYAKYSNYGCRIDYCEQLDGLSVDDIYGPYNIYSTTNCTTTDSYIKCYQQLPKIVDLNLRHKLREYIRVIEFQSVFVDDFRQLKRNEYFADQNQSKKILGWKEVMMHKFIKIYHKNANKELIIPESVITNTDSYFNGK